MITVDYIKKEGLWWEVDTCPEDVESNKSKPRRPRVGIPNRYFWWRYRYYYFGKIFALIQEAHREHKIPNIELIGLLRLVEKTLPRWPKLPTKKILEGQHTVRPRLPRWQWPPRAAFLLGAVLTSPPWEIALTLVALEEGLEPRQIYRGIMKTNAWLRAYNQ